MTKELETGNADCIMTKELETGKWLVIVTKLVTLFIIAIKFMHRIFQIFKLVES